MYYKRRITLFIFIICCHFFCKAQLADSSDYKKGVQHQNEYTQLPIPSNSFDKQEWARLKKKLKIKEYQPKKKEKIVEKKDEDWNLNISPTWSLIIKWTLFGLLIAALLLLVLIVLGINPFTKKEDKNKINIGLDELEENLDTASIDPHLYAAIKAKNYKLAIRLYYLMIIQKLALKEKIIWKKYKTNKHYLNEVRDKEEFPALKNLTLVYEKCWFGEGEVTEDKYNKINTDFVNFLQNIK